MSQVSTKISRQRIGLLLRILGCSMLALSAWALVPRPLQERPSLAPVRVLLVDASDSAQRPQRSWLPWVRQELVQAALAAEAQGEEVVWISFAQDAARGFGPGSPAEFLRRLRGQGQKPIDPRSTAGARGASHLAQGLALASTWLLDPERPAGRLELIGCDGFTGADPGPALSRLRQAAVRLERVPLPPAHWHDLDLRELILEPELEPGAPILALAKLNYRPGASPLRSAHLELEVESADQSSLYRVPLKLPALGGSFDVPVPAGPAAPGWTELRVRIVTEPEQADCIEENDRAIAHTRAAGVHVIVVVAEAERLGDARAWLSADGASRLPGLQFVFVTEAELPAALEMADALLSFDLALGKLPEAWVADFIRRGGGFLATAGWRFLSDWQPGGTAGELAQMLPARPKAREPRSRDVVLLVDGSGSMAGEPFDSVRNAALDLVRGAGPEDRVVLRFFTVNLHPEHVIRARGERGLGSSEAAQAAARRLLALHVPSGSTHILESIEAFLEEMRGRAQETLLFVLTDGRELDPNEGLEGRIQELHAGLAAAHMEILPIAIGARQELGFLRLLARPGEAVAQPDGLAELRELFRREISGAQWRAGSALPLAWAPGEPGSLARSLRGASSQAPAEVERLVLNELRSGGEALWLGDQGEPVLSVGRAGRGRVALLASLPGAGWAPLWLRDASQRVSHDFGSLLRWLARKPEQVSDGLGLRQRAGELVLSGLDASWPAQFEARVVDAVARDEVIFEELSFEPLGPTAGRHFASRRRAILRSRPEVLAAGSPLLELTRPGGKKEFLPLQLPRPQEFGAQQPLDGAWFSEPGASKSAPRSSLEQAPKSWARSVLLGALVVFFLGFALGRP